MLEVRKVRKKLKEAQAVQFTGDNAEEIVKWAKCDYLRIRENKLEIMVFDGTQALEVKPGDYVLKDAEQIVASCLISKPVKLCEKSIFEEFYDIVS